MKHKMRIQLLTPDGKKTSDRLVDQSTELTIGPKEAHEGPITMEFTMSSEEETEKVIQYIKKLVGKIKIPKKTLNAKPEESYTEIYNSVKACKSIEEVINYLTSLDFTFINYDYLEELKSVGKLEDIPGRSHPTFMVRKIRHAVDPFNDRYDWALMFGIDIYKRKDFIYAYKDLTPYRKIKKKWDAKTDINMKEKKKPQKFPKHMSIEDRKKWRYLDRKISMDRPIGPRDSEFYNRHKSAIDKLNK